MKRNHDQSIATRNESNKKKKIELKIFWREKKKKVAFATLWLTFVVAFPRVSFFVPYLCYSKKDLNYGVVFIVNTPILEIVDDKWRTEKIPDDGMNECVFWVLTKKIFQISFFHFKKQTQLKSWMIISVCEASLLLRGVFHSSIVTDDKKEDEKWTELALSEFTPATTK